MYISMYIIQGVFFIHIHFYIQYMNISMYELMHTFLGVFIMYMYKYVCSYTYLYGFVFIDIYVYIHLEIYYLYIYAHIYKSTLKNI
jgi:hypothetical protein